MNKILSHVMSLQWARPLMRPGTLPQLPALRRLHPTKTTTSSLSFKDREDINVATFILTIDSTPASIKTILISKIKTSEVR